MVMTLAFITGCNSIGMAVGLVAVKGALVYAPSTGEDEIFNGKILGNYADEHGFWFDKTLYSVSVQSDSTIKSERIARATATASCTRRGKSLNVEEAFAPSCWWCTNQKVFHYDMKFRCDSNPPQPKP